MQAGNASSLEEEEIIRSLRHKFATIHAFHGPQRRYKSFNAQVAGRKMLITGHKGNCHVRVFALCGYSGYGFEFQRIFLECKGAKHIGKQCHQGSFEVRGRAPALSQYENESLDTHNLSVPEVIVRRLLSNHCPVYIPQPSPTRPSAS